MTPVPTTSIAAAPPGTIQRGGTARHRRPARRMDIPDRTLVALIALALLMLALALLTAALLT
jgi:hypothetical protein